MVSWPNTPHKTNKHAMWKSMKNCAPKWCCKLCAFLFKATFAFWKMWHHEKMLKKKNKCEDFYFSLIYLRMQIYWKKRWLGGSVVDRAPVETDRSEWHAEIHGSGEVGEAVAVRSGHVEVDGLLRSPVSPRSELTALGSVEREPVDVVGRGPAKTSRCDQRLFISSHK